MVTWIAAFMDNLFFSVNAQCRKYKHVNQASKRIVCTVASKSAQ